MTNSTLTWTKAHQERYDAIYSYLKTLNLDINKDDYVEKLNYRYLFKYIMENPKWADSCCSSYSD